MYLRYCVPLRKKNEFVRLWDDPPCIIFVLHYFQFNGHLALCVHIFSIFVVLVIISWCVLGNAEK